MIIFKNDYFKCKIKLYLYIKGYIYIFILRNGLELEKGFVPILTLNIILNGDNILTEQRNLSYCCVKIYFGN